MSKRLPGLLRGEAQLIRAARTEQEAVPHPDPDELLAYQEGRLPDARLEEIAEHLSRCRRCTRAVLDFAAFDEIQVETAPSRARPEVGQRPIQELPEQATNEDSWWRNPALGWVAAGLMLLVLSAEVLTRAVTRPKEPSPVAGWSFLRPPEDGTLRGPGPLRLDLPPGARHALLVFVRSDAKVFDQYRVEIHDASGRLSWNAEGLQRAPDGSVPVLVPVERLHRDPFELRLSGLRGGRWQTLALYSAEISG